MYICNCIVQQITIPVDDSSSGSKTGGAPVHYTGGAKVIITQEIMTGIKFDES